MADRLKSAASAYLRTATESPIDWYPWGTEAFERARAEDKPILLDIGAVWCHWCHVMDHGTYEDGDVVRRLAEGFVCVKVDRDERPDVDGRYQRAVGAITGQGGWPLTAFLTPEGEVFYGGTYFPVQDQHGRPGFVSVLDQIRDVYQNDRDRVRDSAAQITKALTARQDVEPSSVPDDVAEVATQALVREHDHKFGGFGGAPKFPHTGAIALALDLDRRRTDDQMLRLATRTLRKMADGGIHDRVGGGFHRYSVDAHWTVPHFEKMGYDNAELLRVYTQACASTGDEAFGHVANGIVDWVLETGADRELGGFSASQDADVGPEDDGDFFTWTLDELRAALEVKDDGGLSAETLFEIARRRFGVEARGDMHHDHARNVLEIEATVEDIANELDLGADVVRAAESEILSRLRRARSARTAPYVDPTRYTDWNAMYVSAFLQAGAVLDRSDATRHALKTLDRLQEEAWDDERGWLHRPRGETAVAGLLDDQAWMGVALLDGFRFTGNVDLLDRAKATARHLLDGWLDSDSGAFEDRARWAREEADAAPLRRSHRPFLDQSAPGGNPVAARFLLRLGRLTEEPELMAVAGRALEAHAGEAPRMGIFAATWFHVVDEWRGDPPQVTVFGPDDDAATSQLLRVARATPRTGVMVRHVAPGRLAEAPSFLRDVLGNEDLIKDGPRALVCHGDRCDALIGEPDELASRLLAEPPAAT